MSKPIKCSICGKVFSTKFCPDCGLKYDDVKKTDLPVYVTIYVNGDKESGYEKLEELGIDDKSKLGEKIIYAGYEVKLVFKIVGDDLLLHQVDVGDGQGLLHVVKK